MKHLLLTTVAAVVLVGCGESQPPESPDISIWEAVATGNTEVVKQAIADVNTKTELGETPLHLAALEGHKKVAELLIADGVDVNTKDKIGSTPLCMAVAAGHKEVAEHLITKGAEVNGNDGRHPLSFALTKEIAELLIAKGANVNAKNKHGSTPLHSAKTKEVAELLIAEGADVNAKADSGSTPLHQTPSKEIAELLIAEGADVNAKADDSGSTPLHLAAMRGHKETAELLITKGAAVNAKDKVGHTPVDSAERENYLRSPEVQKEIADLLRKHGGKTGEELKAAGK
jgi:ankyrin repeat protein